MAGQNYNIDTSIRFQPLELIDVGALDEACKERWFNTSLTKVNDCVVRLGIIEGEFHWHTHTEEDEFFYVLSGRLFIDLEERVVELGPSQGFTIPRGVIHRTRAPERTVMLMVEGAGVVPTGDQS
jgi:mannose-6-phosphate isomerase-like protein (cupin superfamily)